MTKITLTQHTGAHRAFVAENDKGYCRFSIFGDRKELSSFGGSVWPGSFPDVFEHFGPDKGCITARSGYKLRDDATLPTS
jgi:hypothetical protein